MQPRTPAVVVPPRDPSLAEAMAVDLQDFLLQWPYQQIHVLCAGDYAIFDDVRCLVCPLCQTIGLQSCLNKGSCMSHAGTLTNIKDVAFSKADFLGFEVTLHENVKLSSDQKLRFEWCGFSYDQFQTMLYDPVLSIPANCSATRHGYQVKPQALADPSKRIRHLGDGRIGIFRGAVLLADEEQTTVVFQESITGPSGGASGVPCVLGPRLNCGTGDLGPPSDATRGYHEDVNSDNRDGWNADPLQPSCSGHTV
ncbi:hypothetical protein CcaCcLH18_09412 [Colletotrichum camelliae]|nr:hypothetical protein CcaCcLH18_09412 [Colletotrichum camelliae]